MDFRFYFVGRDEGDVWHPANRSASPWEFPWPGETLPEATRSSRSELTVPLRRRFARIDRRHFSFQGSASAQANFANVGCASCMWCGSFAKHAVCTECRGCTHGALLACFKLDPARVVAKNDAIQVEGRKSGIGSDRSADLSFAASSGYFTLQVRLDTVTLSLCRATHVPVGEDQFQHVELTRDTVLQSASQILTSCRLNY